MLAHHFVNLFFAGILAAIEITLRYSMSSFENDRSVMNALP